MFNTDTGLTRDKINIPIINLKLTEWIEDETKTEGGYLKTRTYKEAWQLYWNGASKEDKQKFLDLPNFDRWVFKDITGIDVEVQA